MEVVTILGPDSGPAPRPFNSEAMWLVGCGNMAGAMVEGWRAANIDLAQATAIRPSGRAVTGVRTVRAIEEAGASPGIVLLGFKPQKFGEIAPGLEPNVGEQAIVLSILAGVDVATLRERFPRAAVIVRVMPNLPVAIRRGVVAVFGEALDEAQRSRVANLLTPLGFVSWCATEAELGAIGSIAGAGPAYVARFVETLTAAGQAIGLDPGLALTVARETVLGTGWLAATTGEPMDQIVRRVRSPNGTTEAGLAVLDAELPTLIGRTIAAAGRRAAELADEARAPSAQPAAIDSPDPRS